MALDNKATLDEVIVQLKNVNDPEIGVNIYDLGLVYKAELSEAGDILVEMTLTSPMCPLADQLRQEVEDAMAAIARGHAVTVNLVWDPPWSLDKLTDAARFQLDMM
jgi:metal-sulfur cluster biosynthetic enzyme